MKNISLLSFLSGIFASEFYTFPARDIDGALYDFRQLKGKVVIVTNVASEWGLAKYHYPQLEQIYDNYRLAGLEVLAFPCNQFGFTKLENGTRVAGQEPGTNAEIKQKVQNRWSPSFQLMAKVKVNGENAHPLYKWLKDGKDITWNFTNFIIDRCGIVRKRHEPHDHPANWEDDVLNLLREAPCDL